MHRDIAAVIKYRVRWIADGIIKREGKFGMGLGWDELTKAKECCPHEVVCRRQEGGVFRALSDRQELLRQLQRRLRLAACDVIRPEATEHLKEMGCLTYPTAEVARSRERLAHFRM